ncbi:MAG: hypothetical protein GXP25_10810 [Planctomycetes bacterium]|nr:hypothetical protein [Planctomycetota bacterium]
MSDWSIKRGELKCSKCSRDFEQEEEYFSALYDEDRQFIRRDYCLQCWNGRENDPVFSFWKTRVPVREQERKIVDDEVVMNFFQRLQGETDPMKINFRYVLALLLMRKKILKLEDIRYDDKGEALVLKQKGEEGEIAVYNPQLTEEQIGQVTEQVGQILNVTV